MHIVMRRNDPCVEWQVHAPFAIGALVIHGMVDER